MTTPHSREAEVSFLTAILREPQWLRDYATSTHGAHFHGFDTRAVWERVRKDFISGAEISPSLIGERLVLDGLGDSTKALVVDMLCSLETLTKSMVNELATTLERYRQLRIGYEHVARIAAACEANNVDDMKTAVESLVSGISHTEIKIGKSAMEIMHDIVAKVGEPGQVGVSTGFPWLDGVLGGLQKKRLIIIAGQRGSGKSALAGQILKYVQLSGYQTSFHSHEMGSEEVVQRFSCMDGVDGASWLKESFARGELDIIAKWTKANPESGIRVYDELTRLEDVLAQMRLDHMRFNTRVWVVDLLQRIHGEKKEGREREISGITWAMKQAAMALDGTVIALSHLNKDLQTRESQDIENHADQIILIGKSSADENRRLIKIGKNRCGRDNVRCLYAFEGKHFRFREMGETEMDLLPQREER